MWFRNKVWQQKQTAMVKCLLQHDRNTEANTSCNVEHKYSLQCVSISIKVFCSCELISLKEARMQWKKMSCALTPLEIIPKWTSVTSVLLPHQKVGTLACIRTIISLSAVEFYYALLIFFVFLFCTAQALGKKSLAGVCLRDQAKNTNTLGYHVKAARSKRGGKASGSHCCLCAVTCSW